MKERNSPPAQLDPVTKSPETALRLDPRAMAAADAAVGAPDPHAESVEDGRQPPAALWVFADAAVRKIKEATGAVLTALAQYEADWLDLPDTLKVWRPVRDALNLKLSATDPGRERALARRRFTAFAGGTAPAVLFETYLTDIALRFLDVAAWERRVIAFGIAVGLNLVAVVASHESRRVGWRKNPAVWLVVTLVVALTVLRYGVMNSNTAWYEVLGGTFVLGAAAAIFALWAAFIERSVHAAVVEHGKWLDYQYLLHEAAAAREQVRLLEKWQNDLPAAVQSEADGTLAALAVAVADARVGMSDYWHEYQQRNSAAAPDIRRERARLLTEIDQHAKDATDVIDKRAKELRARMRPELATKPKPPPPPTRRERSHV